MKKNLYILYGMALLQGMVFYGPIATLYRQARHFRSGDYHHREYFFGPGYSAGGALGCHC